MAAIAQDDLVHESLLLLNVVVYVVLGYVLVFIPLVWLITRGDPDMRTFLDWTLKPVLWPLRLVLDPFGIKLEYHSRTRKKPSNEPSEPQAEPEPKASYTGSFRSVRAAKEFLVGRIVAEAKRQSVPLSEIERKMLYFSETGWTLPGILDVNAEFERDYDDTAYEEKIAGIVRNLQANATPEEQQIWDDAVLKLCEGDHYLLVLIDRGSGRGASAKVPKWLAPWLPILNNEAPRKPGDYLRLYIAAFVIVLALVGIAAIRLSFQ